MARAISAATSIPLTIQRTDIKAHCLSLVRKLNRRDVSTKPTSLGTKNETDAAMQPNPSVSQMQIVTHQESGVGPKAVPQRRIPRPILHCIVRKSPMGPVGTVLNGRVRPPAAQNGER